MNKAILWFVGLFCVACSIAIQHGLAQGLAFLGISILISLIFKVLCDWIL